MRKTAALTMSRWVAAGLFFISAASAARAHEVWIEPVRFQAPLASKIVAQLKIGGAFKGDLLPYIPSEIVAAHVTDGQGKRPLPGLVGDIPAIFVAPRHPGLHVVSYFTTPQRLTYKDPKKFPTFLKNQGLDGTLDAHKKRGLDVVGFTEAYSRCAKTLITRGGAAGADSPAGMPFELIAEANPYTAIAPLKVLPVRLLWQGQPHVNGQIAVFRKGEPEPVAKVRTDGDGRADIPLSAEGVYLLNAVKMIPWDEKPGDKWHSYWASLTFEVGE